MVTDEPLEGAVVLGPDIDCVVAEVYVLLEKLQRGEVLVADGARVFILELEYRTVSVVTMGFSLVHVELPLGKEALGAALALQCTSAVELPPGLQLVLDLLGELGV